MARDQPNTPGVLGAGDLTSSLIVIFPLFLAYEVGVVFSTSVNGVDVFTRMGLALVNFSRVGFLLLLLALAIGFLVFIAVTQRRDALSRQVVMPIVLESAIYALTLGSFIILVMQRVLGFSLLSDVGGFVQLASGELVLGPTGEAIVIALGAGVHEELVFRLGLMVGLAALLKRAAFDHRVAMVIALVASAAIFSFAHHVGPHGEPFRPDVFTYRALAGGIFGLIFYYRSLAHAVYTHFLYDLYVLVIQP